MSLPAGQQRILDGIAETLRLTEPRLTVMFAIFTRLTKNEPPPRAEQLADRSRLAWLARPWQRLRAWRSERGGPGWRRLLIISQMAMAFIAVVVLTCVATRGPAGCGSSRSPRPDASPASHQWACLAPGQSGYGLIGK